MSAQQNQEPVEPKSIMTQAWVPEVREDGVYLVGADDRSTVLKLCRSSRGNDLFIAGYIAGLQLRKLHEEISEEAP